MHEDKMVWVRVASLILTLLVTAACGTVPASVTPVPLTDVLDAAAVAWSACRIAAGTAVTVPDRPQRDGRGLEIAIRY